MSDQKRQCCGNPACSALPVNPDNVTIDEGDLAGITLESDCIVNPYSWTMFGSEPPIELKWDACDRVWRGPGIVMGIDPASGADRTSEQVASIDESGLIRFVPGTKGTIT